MAAQRHEEFDLSQFVEEINYEEIDRKEVIFYLGFSTVKKKEKRNYGELVKIEIKHFAESGKWLLWDGI